PAARGQDLLVFRRSELRQQLALLLRHPPRNLDQDAHQQLAWPPRSYVRHALSRQADHVAILRAGLDRDLGLAAQRRHLHASAQRRLREADGQIEDQVVAVPDQIRVRPDTHVAEQIAARRSVGGWLAFTAQAHGRAVGAPGGNLDGDDPLPSDAAAPAARLARLGDDLSRPAAVRAGRDHPRHEKTNAARSLHLPVAAAGRTGPQLGARLRPVAAADVAEVVAGKLDLSFDVLRDVGQLQFEFDLEVDAAIGPRRTAEHVSEDVAEDAEDVLDAHVREVVHPRAAEAFVPEAVIALALLGVGKHLVGRRRLLELLLRAGVFAIAIGMVFERGLAVGPLDVVGTGVAFDTQHFIQIALGCRHRSSSAPAFWKTNGCRV